MVLLLLLGLFVSTGAMASPVMQGFGPPPPLHDACPCAATYTERFLVEFPHRRHTCGHVTLARCLAFCDMHAQVTKHNALYAQGKATYGVAVRPWHDVPGGVPRARDQGLLPPRGLPRAPRQRSNDVHGTDADLTPHPDVGPFSAVAAAWSWYPQQRVTDVRNQGMCGDCWAESATAVLESRLAQATGNLTQLSVQQAAECTPPEANMGCDGGWPKDVFEYVANNSNHRLCTEATYPTVIGDGADRPCNATKLAACTNATVPFAKILTVPQDNDTALLQALTGDVVSVAIDASGRGFSSYASGVYDGTFAGAPDCQTTELDHAVVAYGWGTLGAVPFYLVRNSWGDTGWGNFGGNILFLRGNNTCGIAHDATYLR